MRDWEGCQGHGVIGKCPPPIAEAAGPHVLGYSHRARASARETQPLHGHLQGGSIAPSACPPPPSGHWAQPLALPSPGPPPLPGQGTPYSPAPPSALLCSRALGAGLSNCAEQILLQENKCGGGKKKQTKTISVSVAVTCMTAGGTAPRHAPPRGLVSPPSPFCPPVLCTHPSSPILSPNSGLS